MLSQTQETCHQVAMNRRQGAETQKNSHDFSRDDAIGASASLPNSTLPLSKSVIYALVLRGLKSLRPLHAKLCLYK